MTSQVATPPDIATVLVSRPSHWTGSEPSTENDTVPVGVAASDGSAATTFALKVGEAAAARATGNRLVVVVVVDADAAGDESHTMASGARAKTATSAGPPRRRMWRGLM